MATISITNDLDVATKYETLVTQSLAGNSAYIRAKETIQELFDNGTITEAEKSSIISNIIGGVVNTITTSSMSTAIAWAQAEKEIALKKLELEKQLDILSQDILVKTAQTEQINNTIRLAKVESKRMHGAGVFDNDNNLISLQDEGKVYSDIAVNTAQIGKISEENLLVQQKVKESYAAVHKAVADTWRNYGNYTYTLTDTGVSSVTKHNITTTLSDIQETIAKEQAKGYAYNAWANALSGSVSAIGTALVAADAFDFSSGVGATLSTHFDNLSTKLQGITAPSV